MRKIYTCDCETDPFKRDRVPEPFLWGLYDGTSYKHFLEPNCTSRFVDYIAKIDAVFYAHNGGKFDFMYLLPWIKDHTRVKIIKSRVVEMKIGRATLRDSWSIMPIALADYEKTKVDYTKFEASIRHLYMKEILAYCHDDCVSLFELVSKYREIAGSRLTIASNALAYARKLDINFDRTHHRFDKQFREFYFGGRCEAFQTGEFQEADCFDIKSAYPFAMYQYHPSGMHHKKHVNLSLQNLSDFKRNKLKRTFSVIECYSHGAFPKKEKYKLEFPHRFDLYKVTGHELLAALDCGLIDTTRKVHVHELHEFLETITLRNYVNEWYAHKEHSEQNNDTAGRLIAKIMLNSLYGKFAQNPTAYHDWIVKPRGSRPDYEQGWALGPEFYSKEIHYRPVLWSLQEKYGDDWQWKSTYYNVATAASITGQVRAMLVRAMHAIGSERTLYCDTDSLWCSPGDYGSLRRDGKLGAWQHEGRASPLYIGGRKLYVAYFDNRAPKKASKGARLTPSEIRRVCLGETLEWQSEVPSMAIGKKPSFLTRKIVATS